jgi:hypothetical protein
MDRHSWLRLKTVCIAALQHQLFGAEALEQHFFGVQARVLKAFSEGRKRIVAVSERKVRARPSERIVLTACGNKSGNRDVQSTMAWRH